MSCILSDCWCVWLLRQMQALFQISNCCGYHCSFWMLPTAFLLLCCICITINCISCHEWAFVSCGCYVNYEAFKSLVWHVTQMSITSFLSWAELVVLQLAVVLLCNVDADLRMWTSMFLMLNVKSHNPHVTFHLAFVTHCHIHIYAEMPEEDCFTS